MLQNMMMNAITNLTKVVENMGKNSVNSISSISQGILSCDFYKGNHQNGLCDTSMMQGEQIQFISNQNPTTRNQPTNYGNTYNPSWRNRLNFSWTNQANIQNSSF
ncbi:hypothetical protein ACH5RR_009283 [Cinchona calisaya]|uniref:Uncharacterized protein n=1 Tax=Cinchona calisaya TaxID=153742 RepID=A0ABD3AG65_9GENT